MITFLNTELAQLWAQIKQSSVQIAGSDMNIDDCTAERLKHFGAELVRSVNKFSDRYILYIGMVGEYSYWIEFLGDKWSDENWYMWAAKLDKINSDRQRPILTQIASLTEGRIKVKQGWLSEDREFDSVDGVITDCLQCYANDLARHQLVISSASQIKATLASSGYFVEWPAEVVFDLERLTLIGTNTRYYLDSKNSIVINNDSEISFTDLTGNKVMLSAGCKYVVEPLTFAGVEELAMESLTLVLSCSEILLDFSLIKGLKGSYEPVSNLVLQDSRIEQSTSPESKTKILYNFYVPIPAISEMMKPIFNTNSLALP